MATSEEKVGGPATDDGFTYAEEVFVDGETLGPESADPGSSQVDPDYTTSKKLKEQAEEDKNESGKGVHNLKSTLIISGAVVAVIGAIFAIAKKIKEADT